VVLGSFGCVLDLRGNREVCVAGDGGRAVSAGPDGGGRRWGAIAARAAGAGALAMVVLPVAVVVAVLAVGHLAGGCGAGSSGGCEMGAAAMGLLAVPAGFVLGACVSVVRALRRMRGRQVPPGG
jgi:hypothetical protein